MSINECLVLQKSVRERVNELKNLRSQVSTKERYFGEKEKTVEPLYDVLKVDKKITQLEMWLFKADAAVKQSNATTEISVEANVDVLLAPLE